MATRYLLSFVVLVPSLAVANTLCPSNTEMKDHQVQKFLNAHNFRRMALARGEVIKRNGNRFPSAANMRKMNYNCTLEANAIAQAKSCSNSESSGRAPDVGENRARIRRSRFPTKLKAIQKAISNWWKESRGSVNIGPNVYYRTKHATAAARFAQMAWWNTDQLGCAVAPCGKNYFVVCQYSPQGLTVGNQIYQPGKPCSACQSENTCENGALCV